MNGVQRAALGRAVKRARALSWGYTYDCGCLVYQVGKVVTVKPCGPTCPQRAEALELVSAHRRLR